MELTTDMGSCHCGSYISLLDGPRCPQKAVDVGVGSSGSGFSSPADLDVEAGDPPQALQPSPHRLLDLRGCLTQQGEAEGVGGCTQSNGTHDAACIHQEAVRAGALL